MELTSVQSDIKQPVDLPTPSVKRVRIQQDMPHEQNVDVPELSANPAQTSDAILPEILLTCYSPPGSPIAVEDTINPAESVMMDNSQAIADQQDESQRPERSREELRTFKREKNQRKRDRRNERKRARLMAQEEAEVKKEKKMQEPARRNEKKRRASLGLDKAQESVDQPAQNPTAPPTLPSTPKKSGETPRRTSWTPLSKDPSEWDVDF